MLKDANNLIYLTRLQLMRACIKLALLALKASQPHNQKDEKNMTDSAQKVAPINSPVTASCKVAELEKVAAKANDKAAKAVEAKKTMKGKLDAANETVRLLEAQLERINGKADKVAADSKRIETAISTIKNIRRMNKGDTIPAESLTYLEEDLTEEFTLGLEHQA